MKLSEAFPSNYLKSDDLQDRDVQVVIASAAMEMVGSERKLIITFQGKKKAMICNKTNSSRIAYLYGDETDEWIGREIVLTSEFVEYQGKTVKGLRIKPPVRPASATPARPAATFTDRKVSGGGTIVDSSPPDPIEEMVGRAPDSDPRDTPF